jgi:hypothetical protein
MVHRLIVAILKNTRLERRDNRLPWTCTISSKEKRLLQNEVSRKGAGKRRENLCYHEPKRYDLALDP